MAGSGLETWLSESLLHTLYHGLMLVLQAGYVNLTGGKLSNLSRPVFSLWIGGILVLLSLPPPTSTIIITEVLVCVACLHILDRYASERCSCLCLHRINILVTLPVTWWCQQWGEPHGLLRLWGGRASKGQWDWCGFMELSLQLSTLNLRVQVPALD